ncbi:NUDIX hydrolase [Lactococcus lactis subsp. lactis]|uniref:NUDIX domain-containing protein n=1 Tax=Lactococcus lactis TaxID=1358 RepID=UPI0021B00618|nr:NUDIX domain-containing protein [Lactococcus lactis]MCT0017718.1 NUDIX hydrolase [Lactococcus lactis subsp. lactis]
MSDKLEEKTKTEKEFLDWYKSSEWQKYEKPTLSIDNVIFGYDIKSNQLKILLHKRTSHPYKGFSSLIGGFVKPNESARQAAFRSISEKTTLTLKERQLWQIKTFTEPKRDPRGWIISVVYAAFLYPFKTKIPGAIWVDLEQLPKVLAFDHQQMIQAAVKRIQENLPHHPDILTVLGPTFTSKQALKVLAYFNSKYVRMSTSNFVTIYTVNNKIIEETNQFDSEQKMPGRPSKLLQLKKEKII